MKLTLFSTALIFLSSATHSQQGNAERGQQIAQQWCANCHQVAPTGTTNEVAPPFSTIARNRQGDPGWVRAWLSTDHPAMPNFNLSRQEIDDVIAYLATLEQQ